jgi:tripartite-type tricarboxylate transporter receptor subunit TctC
MSHVPYKGTSPALQGLMGGETAAMMVGLAEAMPQIKAGRVVAIATSGPTAKGLLPQLPQLQQFHKDLDMTAWFGLWVPASTPKEVVQELNGIVTKLLQQAEFRDRLVDFGMVPTPSTSSELDDLIKRDQARFGPLVRQLELKVD